MIIFLSGIGKVEEVILKTPDDESILLMLDGHYKLSNVTLDCSNVRNGIVLKKGNVIIDSCHILGDGKSSTQQGILCNGNSKLLLKNSTVKSFATGIVTKNSSELMIKGSTLKNCRVGIEATDGNTLALENCKFINCYEYGISCETSLIKSKQLFENLSDIEK